MSDDDDRQDAATAYGTNFAEIAEAITQEAVSRLRASNEDEPNSWPRRLSWTVVPIGLLIETERGSYTVGPDSAIKPSAILRRLVHPEWNVDRHYQPAFGWC